MTATASCLSENGFGRKWNFSPSGRVLRKASRVGLQTRLPERPIFCLLSGPDAPPGSDPGTKLTRIEMARSTDRKVAVITGATGGIGSAVADALFGAGYDLVLNGRSQAKLATIADRMSGRATAVAGDLQDPELPARLLTVALERFGRCDVCLNNGGIIEVGAISDIDIERVAEMVRVNVEATFRVAYVFLKHFVREGSGHLVNTSSVLGKKVRATAGAYAGTKFAIEALSEALRMELSHSRVKVSSIQPGLVMSGLHDRWETHPAAAMGISDPLRPDDIARAVLFVLDQPDHVRIPELMILPKGHAI